MSLSGRVLVLGVLVLAALPAPAAAEVPPGASAPGEIVVVTVNAQQRRLDPGRLHELAVGLATRVPVVPDVIVVQEILRPGLVALRDELNALVGPRYEVVGRSGSRAGNGTSLKVRFLLNMATMRLESHQVWRDECAPRRLYQTVIARKATAEEPLAVAGVHLAPSFNAGGADECRVSNPLKIRRRVAHYGAALVVGDFNKRPSAQRLECSELESGVLSQWYTTMTSGSRRDPRAFHDAVHSHHAGRPSRHDQWTWASPAPQTLCHGGEGHRRATLDYVFASAQARVLEAHVDQGWQPGDQPGCVPAPACRYSDHRFVWARVALPPAATVGDDDTVRDDVDNCVGIVNDDQRDHDADGRGDPCDGIDDVRVHSAHAPYVEAVLASGVAAGCPAPDGLTFFCPTAPVSRAHMAAFLVRAMEGDRALPRPPYETFRDVSARRSQAWFAPYAERLGRLGVTAGCHGGVDFCPYAAVTRGDAAVLLVRALGGDRADRLARRYSGRSTYADVGPHLVGYVEYLVNRSVLPDDRGGSYRPSATLRRGDLARLLTVGFRLPVPGQSDMSTLSAG